MTYMGSKRKYCKYIVPIIQKYIDEHNITVFADVFCGGANLTDKIQC
jgi:adenine-specific DNA methylase